MAVGDTILLRVAEDGSVLDDDNQVLVHALGDALELDPGVYNLLLWSVFGTGGQNGLTVQLNVTRLEVTPRWNLA